MRRIIMAVAVLCSVFGISRASAQTYIPYWSPEVTEVDESSGTVVVTLAKNGPGPVRYRTEDGSCTGYDNMGVLAPSRNCALPARAPDDYGTVSGEVVFTEAGTRKITIPIVDDGLDEGWAEAFTVIATETDGRGGWPAGTTRGTVRIIDDDGDDFDDSGDTPTTMARGPSGSRLQSPVVGGAAPPTTLSRPHLEVAAASDDLRPGPGFELVSPGASERAPEREGGSGSAPWLIVGMGAAAGLGAGAVMWVRRRRQWSPTGG